jgi:hypothetical protein
MEQNPAEKRGILAFGELAEFRVVLRGAAPV